MVYLPESPAVIALEAIEWARANKSNTEDYVWHMIDRTHKLSLTKQAKVLGISLGSVYYRPRSVDFCIEAVEEGACPEWKARYI